MNFFKYEEIYSVNLLKHQSFYTWDKKPSITTWVVTVTFLQIAILN